LGFFTHVGIVSPNACVLTVFTLEREETLHEQNSLAEVFWLLYSSADYCNAFSSSTLSKSFLKMSNFLEIICLKC
jgi:hypothetical protein